MAIEKPTYKIFHEFSVEVHNIAIRMLLEGDDRSNAALLRLYTLYGIIRNASEYWQNRSGYRYVRAAAGTGTWLPTSIEKPSYADILGFFEDKSFKLIR